MCVRVCVRACVCWCVHVFLVSFFFCVCGGGGCFDFTLASQFLFCPAPKSSFNIVLHSGKSVRMTTFLPLPLDDLVSLHSLYGCHDVIMKVA